MANRIPFSCVAAMDAKRGIGKNQNLPWHLPKDMHFFKEITSNVKQEGKENVVLMGRKTWESIPKKYRPLPHRVNIVLSKMLKTTPDGADYMCSSLDDALDMIAKEPLASQIERVFVVGGGVIYKVAMEHESCRKLYITEIQKDYDCDVFFPEFDKNVYQPSSDEDVSQEPQEDKGVAFNFCVYERK